MTNQKLIQQNQTNQTEGEKQGQGKAQETGTHLFASQAVVAHA